MERREFLKLGGAGLAVAAGAATPAMLPSAAAQVPTRRLDLSIERANVELIDGTRVDMLTFAPGSGTLLSRPGSTRNRSPVPGPVIRVAEGETIVIAVKNTRDEDHSFFVPGLMGTPAIGIRKGETREITVTAGLAGTYMYLDTAASYRVLGLHGALVVHPRDGRTAAGSVTPYSFNGATRLPPYGGAGAEVAALFDALGTGHFEGRKWSPSPIDQEYALQERIWLFNQIDPALNRLVTRNRLVPRAAAEMRGTFVPRYFTINGLSGFDLSEEPSVVIANYIGEPTLIRTMNAGLCHHATHIHGNHLFELSHSHLDIAQPGGPTGFVPIVAAPEISSGGRVVLCDSVWERDTWPTYPMQTRDMLLPFEVPQDIPDWNRLIAPGAQERFPLRYVMHDHCEMGTTAAGGNYPQGAVTHWEILGPMQPVGLSRTI